MADARHRGRPLARFRVVVPADTGAARRPASPPARHSRPTEEIPPDAAAADLEEPERLRLAPLSPQDAVALAAERTGAAELAAPVATLVRERAEGNPLFIEQLTYAMRDAGRIVVDHGLLRPASGDESLDT